MEPVPTGCDPVDDLLGGGLERGAVTQVYGPPASGKTNIALSAAIETAATGSVAVYVDTEGVSTDRFQQLLSARASTAGPPDGEPGVPSGDAPADATEDLARDVIVSEARDADEQAEAVRDAADLADRAGLLIVDSVTGFYRLERDADDGGEALRRITRQVTALLGAARRHDCAVLLTNQVYTDPDTDRARPLGGHTLAHWSGAVVRLDRFRGGNRRATLEQHRSRPAGDSTAFRITETGFEAADGPATPQP
jgi:DNA repair protein RadB